MTLTLPFSFAQLLSVHNEHVAEHLAEKLGVINPTYKWDDEAQILKVFPKVSGEDNLNFAVEFVAEETRCYICNESTLAHCGNTIGDETYCDTCL